MRKFRKSTLAAGAGVVTVGCALTGFAVSPAFASTVKPAVPQDLTVQNGSVTTNGVGLAWSKVSGATGYQILVVNASTPSGPAAFHSGDLTGTSVKITTLKPGIAYEA